MRSLEEYAVECAVNKVFASEVLNYVVDENVQIYGGFFGSTVSAAYAEEMRSSHRRATRIADPLGIRAGEATHG